LTAVIPPPTLTPPEHVDARLRDTGYAVLAPEALAHLAHASLDTFRRWSVHWDDLPLDTYLRDGGRYRRRRHSCFVVDDERVVREPPRPHYQTVEYNALHGGLERWFEPMGSAWVDDPAWPGLLVALAARATSIRGGERRPWFVEAHPFRITTADGIGRPTPEGAHRDGVDLVAVTLVARHGVKGGETRIFEATGSAGVRFTLTEPWTTVLLDDARVIHESTPIQPTDPLVVGYRDTLVITLRAGGFQSPLE
jgi:hypothetical protein